MRYLDSLFGLLKLIFYKLFFSNNITFSPVSRVSRKVQIRFRKNSKLVLGKRVSINSGVSLGITENAILKVENGVGIGANTNIVARERILIGKNVMIAPNVIIYDHDHVYKTEKVMKNTGYRTAPIVIEDNVWIGAGVIILKGVTIGSGSVVAAGTVINKDIPANSIVYNKKELVIKSKI